MIKKLVYISHPEESIEKEKTFTEGVETGLEEVNNERGYFNPLGK